ncbi:MAG: DUF6941 family protein [Mycobacteriales bacterium]
MRLTALLCDAAQVSAGKLYVMGGGWTVTGPVPGLSALAVLLEVPWTSANRRIPVVIELHDQDGGAVRQPGPEGTAVPVRFDVQVEVGRPPGLPEGTPLSMPLAITVPPLALEPGKRYSWDFQIDGETQEGWYLPFSTRSLPPGPPPPG